MATSITTSKTSELKNIIIRRYPFDSPIATDLVNALDKELEVMYPDWATLPHPGFQQDWVGGDSLQQKVNPVPKPSSNQKHASLKDLLEWETSGLHLHVAFDLTDTDTPPAEYGSMSHETLSSKGKPVGCIGVKPMPFFPYHREPPSNAITNSAEPGHRYAEIKRAYIMPSHRGLLANIYDPVRSALQEAAPMRLAEAMVRTAAFYARDQLHVDRLVLETGVRQIAAIKLYERLGWQRRQVFGDYVGASVEVGGVSMCYEYDISQS